MEVQENSTTNHTYVVVNDDDRHFLKLSEAIFDHNSGKCITYTQKPPINSHDEKSNCNILIKFITAFGIRSSITF